MTKSDYHKLLSLLTTHCCDFVVCGWIAGYRAVLQLHKGISLLYSEKKSFGGEVRVACKVNLWRVNILFGCIWILLWTCMHIFLSWAPHLKTLPELFLIWNFENNIFLLKNKIKKSLDLKGKKGLYNLFICLRSFFCYWIHACCCFWHCYIRDDDKCYCTHLFGLLCCYSVFNYEIIIFNSVYVLWSFFIQFIIIIHVKGTDTLVLKYY